MKKLFAAFLLLLALTGCGAGQAEKTPLAELPEDYSLEQAKADGVVVYENLDISSGQEAWDSFTEASSAGKAASVRLGWYYTLDEPSRYDPDYYESIKDDYPLLFIQDLDFDGQAYTLSSIEEGQLLTETWKYLVRYEEDAPSQAKYDRSIGWVLLNDEETVNDPDMTYHKLWLSLASAQTENHIPHHIVYNDYIYINKTP